jgi:hypothetical protein
MGEPSCQYITNRRTSPEGYPQHQCQIVAQVSGQADSWVGDQCLGACTGDDGSSACTISINALLRLRVAALWDRSDADDGCAGSLSLSEAFALLLDRQGQAEAEATLVRAVAGGMPRATAESLALANGIPLGLRIMPTLRERLAEAEANRRRPITARTDLRHCGPCKEKMLAAMRKQIVELKTAQKSSAEGASWTR